MKIFLTFLPIYVTVIVEVGFVVFILRTLYLICKGQKEMNELLMKIASRIGTKDDVGEEWKEEMEL